MDEEFLAYYNNELNYLRSEGALFAKRFSKVAGRLQLEATECADPHVERLLEGVAFLTARVRQKIDDEFPEITRAFLDLLYPHFLRPVPSMTVVQMVPGPEVAKLVGGYSIKEGSRLDSAAVRGQVCQFRTVYPVMLWPLEVVDARLYPDRVGVPGKPRDAVGLLQVTLRCTSEATIDQLKLDCLRFYIDSDRANAHALYELLLNNSCEVAVRVLGAGGEEGRVSLGKGALRPVGFGPGEGMFPYPSRSLPGYRLLQEYFAFPEKFLFFEVMGLEKLRGGEGQKQFELLIFLNRSPRSDVTAEASTLKLGCTPAANLFSKVAEPIRLDHTQFEYRVVPDVHKPMGSEVYSIEEVTSTSSYLDEPQRFEPFNEMRHELKGEKGKSYWHASRRPSGQPGDLGSDVFLSFVDSQFQPARPATDTVTARILCTNRDIPPRLPYGGDQGDFLLESAGPVSRVRCLCKPTNPQRPKLGRASFWPLVSHLSLNHLSLVDSSEGLDSLRAILRLYDWADSAATRQQIQGITGVSCRRVAGRTGQGIGNVVCQGLEVTLEFDESHFVGSGVYLLASVLERFLGMYASINSFSQLAAKTRQREGVLKRWPPRAGYRTLL